MPSRVPLAIVCSVLLAACQPPPQQPPLPQQPPVPRSAPKESALMLQTGAAPATQRADGSAADHAEEDYRLVSEKDEIVSVLRNGLVVITKRVASPVVAVRGYAFTGGVYEGRWLGGGLSHLLEHLVVAGSNGRRSEEQNKQLLQAIGNNSNAGTTEHYTEFFINTTPEHMEQAVDLVTGWMFTAAITPDEYRREYEVVQRELEMGKGEPDRQLYYMMAMNRYRVSPARVPVIGYQSVIQGLSRDDVYNYYKLAYVPNNMMFVVTGDADPEAMLKAVRKNSPYPPGRAFSHDIAAEPPVQAPRTAVATFPKLGQARLNIAFPGVSMSSPDLYAMDLLGVVLGQSESAILVQELRDKRQLVTDIAANDDTPSYADGSFDVTMELEPDKVQQATAAVLDVLDSVKTTPIDDARIARAKTLLRSGHIRQSQRSEDIAASLGTDYLATGNPHFTDIYLKRVDELTAKDLQAVAQKYFDRGKLITTAMFPAEYAGAAGMPKVEDVLRPAATTQQVAQKSTTGPADVQRTVLENGTILLTKRIPTSPIVYINMYSLGGLTAEDAKSNGLGNLAMQSLTRGTATRDARQIAEFFDSIGGAIGAACGNNTWSWNASTLTRDFDKGFEAYADVVNTPAFADEQVAEIKRRTLAAIAAQDADWTAQAGRFFKKEFYGPSNSPYQFLTIGTKENVERFTAGQLKDWYQQKVQKSPRVLAVYGDIDPDHVKQLAADLLGKGEKRPEPSRPDVRANKAEPAAPGGAPSINVIDVKVQKTEQKLAGVIIGFKSDSVIGDPANYTLDVIDTLTSGFNYPTGYIFETLRGLGLVYVADAHNVPGRSPSLPGMFQAYAGCAPENVNKVVDLTLENIARVEGSDQDINLDWFARAKELMVVSDAMENETPAAQAQMAAVDEVLGLGYDFHRQFPKRVRDVALPQIRQLARQRLNHCLVTISTPNPELVQVKPGVRTYDKFPPVDLAPKGVQHDVGAGAK